MFKAHKYKQVGKVKPLPQGWIQGNLMECFRAEIREEIKSAHLRTGALDMASAREACKSAGAGLSGAAVSAASKDGAGPSSSRCLLFWRYISMLAARCLGHSVLSCETLSCSSATYRAKQ